MKKFFLPLLAATMLFGACETEDASSSSASSAEVNSLLSTMNVSDAAVIYKKSSSSSATSVATRSEGEEVSYWKIDFNGDEYQLTISDEEGAAQNIGIDTIISFSDRILYVVPNTQDIYNILNSYVSSNDVTCLVDTETNKMYRGWTNGIELYNGTTFDTDIYGNIYFIAHDEEFNAAIYKLDISTFTISELTLPSSMMLDQSTSFTIFGDGYIIGWDGSIELFVRYPSGGIYNLDESQNYFIYNKELYSEDGADFYHWDTSTGTLNPTLLTFDNIDPEYDLDYNYYSKVLDKVILGCLYTDATNTLCWSNYTFDGTSVELITDTDGIYFTNETSTAWWSFNSDGLLCKRDKLTAAYTETDMTAQFSAYYVDGSYSSNAASPNIYFTGYRYSDGYNIVGTIDGNNNVTVEASAESGSVIELVQIN